MPDTTETPELQPTTTHDSTEEQTEHETSNIDNDALETLFDALDERTAYQQLLHDRLADGFMALARERYANPSSLQSKSQHKTFKPCRKKKKTLSKLKHHSLTQNFRTNKTRDLKTGLGRLVHDNRQDLRSNLLLQIIASAPDNPHAPPIVSRFNNNDDTSHQASPPSSQPTLRKRRATYKREEEEAARRRGAAQPQLQTNVHNTVMAMPSAEMRDAMRSFREVVEACVEVVNATGRVERELENMAKR